MLNKNEYDHFMNSDQSSADAATHEYELELISDSSTMIEPIKSPPPPQQPTPLKSNDKLGLSERTLSAAGAAVLSAVIVNPLDVVKTRLQAQAAGVAYSHPMTNHTSRMAVFGPNMMFADLRCSPTCTRAGVHGTVSICPPDCFEYKGTLDVFYKIIRQEGVARLWRGTNAGLALAVPTVGIYLPCYDIFRNWFEEFSAQNAPSMTPYAPLLAGSLSRSLACTTCYPIELARTRMQAFKDFNGGKKSPGVWKTLVDVLSSVKTSENMKNVQSYRALWTGLGAQLARDVPFSAICWSTLEPVRRRLLSLVGEEANAVSVLGANFSAGFVAGSLAAAATCPLDVAKTRRQIEKDPIRALRMTTRQTLMEVWRDGGMRGLFTGVGPRVGRAGPSVGIVVSFYEVVKYALHRQQHAAS
ncbi:putative mitochondrial carrier domain superfamily [Helianthus annuus]|uniref:Mitochondrial carrier domain protein n=1 Tax=Helianthus annuus TaxID=4232 RepID=A0A251SR62_HELAN|nr:mitochondrial carrier protein MTM1 [Helianthus annuus]KAF5771427.1 putative mitochondrial carrier domain protein [Helianthus annuus]KAJ0471285.1 putative mitochondrial carrier domain superfamily [Helianthus annuus]KAJ0705569.1 putative mitochondrial carrier domain superfamily [Helianthus annuus]KAJ0842603.1 putative mitochondrial carrier domain protein [Helianthus annuus]KAJ0856264.1 putative mitochondrial carrier domain superfamily [Helianthus annuus]